jgi:predicted RNA methylase
MRLEARIKMGYYPTPLPVVDRIRSFIKANERITILDPCRGEGLALERLVEGLEADTYGVELDKHRAEEARTRLKHVLRCGIEEARISHGCFSLMLLNPPYDWETEADEHPSRSGRRRSF